MGGSKTIATSEVRLGGLQIQNSGYGVAIPICYGLNKVAPNLIYYTDWKAIPHTTTTTTSGGGKGGSTTMSNTTYSYSATVIFGLCEGPISGVGTLWRNNSVITSPSTYGITVFNGTYPQYPWGYVSTYHPSEALGYQGVALGCAANYDLGTGSLGNHMFEIQGIFYTSTTLDVNPKDVIYDFLTNINYGVGFPATYLGDYTAIANYCTSAGILISPVLSAQRPAHEWLTEWATIANAGIVWSEGKLKIIPYATTATVQYNLTDDDFIVTGSEDPIVVTRKKLADAFNHIQIEFINRANQYNIEPAEAKDQANIEAYGLRTRSSESLHSICVASVAKLVAQSILQRELYIRNTYAFTLSWKYCLLEPMDVVTLTDTALGLNQTPVRIIEVDESPDGLLTITAEEYNAAYSNPYQYTAPPTSGYIPNYGVVPSIHSTATIFLAPAAQTVSGYEIWMAINNLDANYGGSQIWMSYDNLTYFNIGKLTGNTTAGVTTANLAAGSEPDTFNTLSVDVTASGAQIVSVNQTTVDTYGTLSLVGNEFLAYRDALLTSTAHYNLTYMHRGLYNSAQGSNSGARFVKCDDTLFKYPYDPALAGKTLYFKFVAYNSVGAGLQDISTLSPYAFTVSGQLGIPVAPSAFNVSQAGATTNYTWAASPTAGVSYALRYVPQGNTPNWADAVVLNPSVPTMSYSTTAMVPGAWTFMLAAEDISATYSMTVNANFTVTNTLAVQKQNSSAPNWQGTLTNMVAHWTGKLIPQSQNLANADLWPTFDTLVPNPFASCSFEVAEFDLGADLTVRGWAAFAGTMPATTVGTNQPQLWLDYRLAAGSYAGYQRWTNANLTGRYVKMRMVIDTTVGVPCISLFNQTLDM